MLASQNERLSALYKLLEKRILVIDGAMGTMIQRYKLTESDFRGTHKQPVFCIFERDGRVYKKIVPDCKKATL